jgi:hypothetical protein
MVGTSAAMRFGRPFCGIGCWNDYMRRVRTDSARAVRNAMRPPADPRTPFRDAVGMVAGRMARAHEDSMLAHGLGSLCGFVPPESVPHEAKRRDETERTISRLFKGHVASAKIADHRRSKAEILRRFPKLTK